MNLFRMEWQGRNIFWLIIRWVFIWRLSDGKFIWFKIFLLKFFFEFLMKKYLKVLGGAVKWIRKNFEVNFPRNYLNFFKNWEVLHTFFNWKNFNLCSRRRFFLNSNFRSYFESIKSKNPVFRGSRNQKVCKKLLFLNFPFLITKEKSKNYFNQILLQIPQLLHTWASPFCYLY